MTITADGGVGLFVGLPCNPRGWRQSLEAVCAKKKDFIDGRLLRFACVNRALQLVFISVSPTSWNSFRLRAVSVPVQYQRSVRVDTVGTVPQ